MPSSLLVLFERHSLFPRGNKQRILRVSRFLKSMSCYLRHLQPTSSNYKTNTSVWHLMYRCLQCQTWMTNKLLANHKCKGQKQCKICKNIVESDHQCYVQKKPEKRTNYSCAFISISSALKNKEFISLTCVWLIGCVKVVTIYLWINPVRTVRV